MTEAEFYRQKEMLRQRIREEQRVIDSATTNIRFYEDWLIDLMDVGQQEPWWGEAND